MSSNSYGCHHVLTMEQTVILDCCYSASGAREGELSTDVRGVVLDNELPLDLDLQELSVPIACGSQIETGFGGRGLASHVLISACKERRSLHSPPFSGQTPGGLQQTQPIQNANFLALELLELSSDFLVTFWCMLTGLVESDRLSGGLTAGISPNQLSYSTGNDRTAAESPMEVQQKSGGLQQTPSRQLSLLVLLIKNEN